MADELLDAGAQPAAPAPVREEEPNPFADRLAKDPSLGEVSNLERARLDAVESYARGTLLGAGNMPVLQRDAVGGQEVSDEFGNPIGTMPASPVAAKRLESLREDLARQETMRGFDGPLEGLSALAGTLGGALGSPESFINRVPGLTSLVERMAGKVASPVASRIAGAAATQGAVQGGVNPAVQGLENASGMRKGYSGSEVAGAVAGGVLIGGVLHGAGEVVSALVARGAKPADAAADVALMQAHDAKRAAEAKNMADLAAEDPSLRSGPADTTAGGGSKPDQMTPAVVEGDTASVTLPEQAVEAPAMDAAAVVANPEAAAAKAAADVPVVPEGVQEDLSRAASRDATRSLGPGFEEQAPNANRWDSRITTVQGFEFQNPKALEESAARAARNRAIFDGADPGLTAPLELHPEARQVLDQVDPRLAPAIEEAIAPPAPKRQGLSLVRENFDPSAPPKGPGELDRRAYAIERDGERVGTVVVKVDGNVAEVRDIYGETPGTSDQRNVLGPGAVSTLLRQFLAENPQIERLTGERVSGARRGGQHDFAGTGERIEVRLPDVRRGPTAIARTQGGKPLSISQFIARNGGLALDGEASARDLGKVFVPGAGPLARKNGRTIDGHWREALIEGGYLPADADGMAARNVEREVFDAIDREQRGERLYSAHDDVPIASEIDNLHREVQAEAKKISKALKKAGISERETDPRTLTDAGELMWRGEETDALAAYERAAMMRAVLDEDDAARARSAFGELPPGWDDDAVLGRAARADGAALRGEGEGRARSRQEGGPDRPGGELPRAGEGSDGIRFRQREPAAGDGQPRRPDALAAPGDGNDAAAQPLRSLQQQVQDLADVLDLPMRQGRLQGGKLALGQFDVGQDVVRMRSVADMGTFAHESAHALEQRIPGLTDLVNRYPDELGPLDYEPTRGDAGEGFAEWLRMGLTNPATMQAQAPGFAPAFRALMARERPDLLAKLDEAGAAFRRYDDATGAEQAAAIVRPPEREGILNSIRKDGLASTIRMVLSRAYETFSDDKSDVNKAVREMARSIYVATGKRVKLEGSANPELLVRQFARAQQAALADMQYGVRPWHGNVPEGPAMHDAISTAVGAPGILGRWDEAAVKAFDDYMVMRRAEVLYRKFDAGEMPNRPVAMSAEKVRAAIAEAEAANPTFRAGSDQMHGYGRELLRKQYEGGLISAETYGRLMGEEFYVPMYRHMDDKPGAGSGSGSGSGGSDGPGTVDTIKTIKGSDRDVIPPTQSLITQTLLVNRTLQHNDIVKSLVSLSRQVKEAGGLGAGHLVEEIPATQMMGKKFDLEEVVRAAAKQNGTTADDMAVLTGAITDVFGDDPIMASIFRAEPTGKRSEPIVFYKEGGELRAVRFSAKSEGLGLYEAIAGLPPVGQDIALKMVAYASGVTRAGITADPTFVLSNFVRDQFAVGILRTDYIPFVSGFKGIMSEVRQDQFAQMYAYAGGVSPGAGAAGLSEVIEGDINALARKGWLVQKVGGLADLQHGNVVSAFKAFAEIGGTSESATRLSVFQKVYKQKIKQGLSQYDAMLEAAYQATDLMDFGRHGSGTMYLRALVPFMNAHTQGLDKFRRTALEPIWRAAMGDIVSENEADALRNAVPTLIKMAGVGGALGFGYGLWASQYRAHQDASPELRASHLIIPGEPFGFEPNATLVIPKPFELAIGFNLGELLGLHMQTGDPRAAEWAITGMREVLQPPNPLTSIPLAKTYQELALNRSFHTGRDIVAEKDQNKEHPELEFNDRTSGMAKAIGQAIGVSPIKVDYAIGSQFGTLGRNLVAATNAVDPNAPDASWQDTMFFRRWLKGADRTSETTKTFWENAAAQSGNYAQANNTFSRMVKLGKDREAYDYLGQLPAPVRAYVTLFQGAAEGSDKAAFKADDRRLHPIGRGAIAVQQVGGLIKDLTADTVKTFEDGTPIKLTPTQRRDAIDSLRELQAMEMQNALTMAQQKGYAGRKLMSVEDQFAVLKAKSPAIASELATRYATAKVLPTETVARIWPEAQKALLIDGSEADIHDLALDAKGDGYAFGGDAVRRPQKRRASITPGTPPALPIPARPGGIGEPTRSSPTVNPFQ